jgi:hypothetical protein
MGKSVFYQRFAKANPCNTCPILNIKIHTFF